MKNTMKRLLCTLLVMVMLVSSLPVVYSSASNYETSVTIDISDHRSKWYYKDTDLGFFEQGHHNAHYADIVVGCIDANGNREDIYVDVLINTAGVYNFTYYTSSKPKYIVIDFYCGEEYRYDLALFDLYPGESSFNIKASDSEYTLTSSDIVSRGSVSEVDFLARPVGIPISGILHLYSARYVYELPDDCYEPLTQSIPVDYDFNEDRWDFMNFKGRIDKQYYIDMYGESKAQEIYDWAEGNGSHYHCFGLAMSTAATLFDLPSVNQYISWNGLPKKNLRSVNKGTLNMEMGIFAQDYIKYCYIYQGSASVASQRNNGNNSGIENVYNAVKSGAQNHSGTGIVIDFFGGSGHHSVYAIGIDGDDILVNDSNTPANIKRINVDGYSWSYSAGGYSWDSSNAVINYIDDVNVPYVSIMCNVDIEGKYMKSYSYRSSELYSEEDEIEGNLSNYAYSMKKVDSDKLLIVSEKDSFSYDTHNIVNKVLLTGGADVDRENQLYWLDSGSEIKSKNESEETATLKVVGNELKITADLPSGAEVDVEIDENGNNDIDILTEESEEIAIAFTTVDENGEFIDATITGTASDTEITATQTDTGLVVTGISDGTVTLTKDDEVIATEEIEDAVGDVEITYDKDGEDEDVELDYHSHSYASEITTPATHLTEGVETFICGCGDTYTEPVAKLEGHTYTSEITKEATHTVEGVMTYTCDCGDSYTEPVEKIAEHTYEKTEIAPSCTANGIVTYTCACNDSYTETIEATGHSYADNGICKNCDNYDKAYDKSNKTDNCSCNCHKGGFMGFIWKLINFFYKLFGVNKTCSCGASHY